MENQLTPHPPDQAQLSMARMIHGQPLDPRYSSSAGGASSPEGAENIASGNLLEYWRIIRRHKGAIIVMMFCGAALGVLVTLPQTPVYQARTSLEVQDLNENFLNIKEVTPESQTYNALSDIQTQIKILQSSSLAARTIAKLKIASPKGLKLPESRVNVWRRALNLPQPAPIDARDAALAAAASGLTVRAAGQTRIIEVLVDSTDPKIASDFANTLANEFIDQAMEARWKMTQRTGDWLSRQMDDMRIKLERSEDALQSYARQNDLLFTGGVDGKDKTNISEDKLKQLQQELSAAQADRIAKQSRYEMAQNSSPESLADVLNDTSLRDYQTKITDLRRQLAELETTYTADHPKVKRVEAQIGALNTAFQRERGAILKRIYNDFQEAQRKENLLATAYAGQSRIVSGEGEKSIQYNILKREVDTNRQLYEAMLQKVKEASIAAALKASNVRVVDAAVPPRFPYKPNSTTNAAIGLFGGCILGLAFIVMRERADRTFQSPGDAAYWLNLPELGAIPSAQVERRMGLYRARVRQAPLLPNLPAKTDMPERVELVTAQRKESMLAESFRGVLTSLMFSGENGHRARVLVLTSSSPAEGKTTVAANLAIAIAEIGNRVLLIDADMRKPRIHDIFGLPNESGLATLLQERTHVEESSVASAIYETPVPGLMVLPSGPPHPGATTLFYSPRFAELLKYLRREYDMVIIDSPPMMQMPDARVAGRIADGVVLVLRCGRTTRDAALAAQERLTHDNTRILGTILNDWNPRGSSNGYYNGYYGYHYNSYYSNEVPKEKA